MRRHWFLVAVVGLCWTSLVLAAKPVAPEKIEGVTRVSAEEVVELLTSMPGLVLVDSRYGEEFAKGHIEGAINLVGTELKRAELMRVAPGLDTPLLFYCNGERCLRSATGAQRAVQWGYRKVYWFRNGWHEWTAKQLPVSR